MDDRMMQCALASSAMGEHGDCSVRAVALTTNVPYETAHIALRVAGRRNRRGAFENQIIKATRSLGYTVDPKVIPKQSNGSLYTAKTIGRVYPTGNYLVYTRGHVFALVNGSVLDWTEGKKHRVLGLQRVKEK